MKLEIAQRTAKPNRLGSILFVHGVCHDATCWHNYMEYFSDAGYDTYALSLRGYGKSQGGENLNCWGASDYVTDVTQVISTIDEKPILVGPSMERVMLHKVFGEHESCTRAAVLTVPVTKRVKAL